jgi:hypothetical protein
MKYTKKLVVIDAVQWTGKNHREIFDFLTENAFDKESMQVTGDHFHIDHTKVEGGLIIKTSEGEHLATIGDYIIRGVQGEYYPCKEDIFNQTYEKVDDTNIQKGNSIWGNNYQGQGIITVPCNTTTTSTAFYPNSNPQPNGIKCPKCNEELMDTYPNMILTSDPPQKNVHCPKCNHKGYRFI